MSDNASRQTSPAISTQDTIADIIEATNKPKKPEKPARARKLPTPNHHLVAFVDILGFSNEIVAATTPTALKDAYDKLRYVQKQFEKPCAVDDTEEEETHNTSSGKRVIALWA